MLAHFTVLSALVLTMTGHITSVLGAGCATEAACTSCVGCRTGGVVYCCPEGGTLVVNGSDPSSCRCDAGRGMRCSGGAQLTGSGTVGAPCPAENGGAGGNGSAAPRVTSASGLTCALMSLLAVLFVSCVLEK